jgi:hypothetical protein
LGWICHRQYRQIFGDITFYKPIPISGLAALERFQYEGVHLRWMGAAMNSQSKIGEFLAKAKEAEEFAAKAVSPPVQEIWLRIAFGYRDLARADGYKD